MGMDTEVAIRSNMSAGKSSFKSWLGIDTIVSYPNPTHRYRCLTLFTWSFSVSLFVWAMLMQCMFKLSLIPSTIYLSCNKNNPMQHHNHLNHPTQCTQILWKALHHRQLCIQTYFSININDNKCTYPTSIEGNGRAMRVGFSREHVCCSDSVLHKSWPDLLWEVSSTLSIMLETALAIKLYYSISIISIIMNNKSPSLTSMQTSTLNTGRSTNRWLRWTHWFWRIPTFINAGFSRNSINYASSINQLIASFAPISYR